MDRYNIALTDKGAKVKLVRELLLAYMLKRKQIFENIQEACRAAKRLEEIGLGTSLLSSVAYIERLIDSEETSNRPNKTNRLHLTDWLYYFMKINSKSLIVYFKISYI